jgi:DNA-binding HxlR family transcriptional regulator
LDILDALNRKPLRYTDLKPYGRNERTRTRALRQLEERGLVQTSTIKIGKRSFVHYVITDKGKTVLVKARELEGLSYS